MPVFSKITLLIRASSDGGDYHSGFHDYSPPSPFSKGHSVLSGRYPNISQFSNPTLGESSRHPASGKSAYRSGSATGVPEHSRHAQASEERRSPYSYISVSSDDPEATNVELAELHKAYNSLKVECGRLRGRVTGLE